MSKSCPHFIYEGTIRHRRFTPFKRNFKYRIFMMYLDLGHLDDVFNESIFWNTKKRAIVSFRRADYHGDPSISLLESVKNTVFEKTGKKISGPVTMLAHLRYFGYCFNPVTFYYCYNEGEEDPELILAEVTNTPWNERHSYIIDKKTIKGKSKSYSAELNKEFHVSPFWGMDHEYEWLFSGPNKDLFVNMKNFLKGNKVFDATLDLKRSLLTRGNLIKCLIKYPFITLKVTFTIHWQAMILWLKRAPFYTHPAKLEQSKG